MEALVNQHSAITEVHASLLEAPIVPRLQATISFGKLELQRFNYIDSICNNLIYILIAIVRLVGPELNANLVKIIVFRLILD